MKAFFAIINYNSDEHSVECVHSIKNNTDHSFAEIAIHIYDNSEKEAIDQDTFRSKIDQSTDITFCDSNLGYFGCIPLVQKHANDSYDFIIYCNPDITFASNFLQILGRSKSIEGLIAPSIISKSDHFDQNPKYPCRLKQEKMSFLKKVHSNPITYKLFHTAARLRELTKRNQKTPTTLESKKIYALHGAAIIFNDYSFFESLKQYPCFLFGEELFLAEEAGRAKVNTTYVPELKITDSRHSSVAKLTSKTHRKYMLEAISYILGAYYQNSTE